MSNATIANTSPTLPPLEIPNSKVVVDTASPELPAFDPTKVKPCNMTEVNAKRTSNPIRDENHMIPIHDSTQTEQTMRSSFIQGQYGVGIEDSIFLRGVAATQFLDTSYTIASNAVLYGPTLKCPAPCPLEVSTVYSGWHDVYMIGIWDFSLGSDDWAHYLEFDDDGQSYINQYYWDEEYYQVRICENQYGDWAAFLYNYDTYQWDEVYVQADDDYTHYDGWDMYEAKWWTDTDWPPTPNTRSSNMKLYVWDIINGWHWEYNTFNLGYSYSIDYNTGPLVASGNYRYYNQLWYDWTAGALYAKYITFCGQLSGNGNAWDGEKLIGCVNDDQFARIYAGNYGDAGGITARMIRPSHGYVFVNAYSASGYYNSHLYIYVSSNGQDWTPLNGGNPITINYWDGRQDFYCGYSSSDFNYIAFAGYDDNGFSVNLYLDHVFIYYNL
jgi:hypothetical protein